jgi:CheY-like chemotaxis protein
MSKTILLADDSVTIQKVVELSFADEGYRVVGVANGDDAVSRLGEVAPDLVIADIHMPGANGYEVATKVKQMRPGTPVLLLVGTFEPFDRERFTGCGADAYMKKPFDSHELLRQVQTLLAAAVRLPPPASPEARAADGADSETTAANPVIGWAATDYDDSPSFADDAPRATEQTLRMPALPSFGDPIDIPPVEASASASTATNMAALPATTGSMSSLASAAVTSASYPVLGAEAPASQQPLQLSEVDIDRICRRVLEVLSEKVVREIGWEVVPDLAEVIIKDRLREIESQVEPTN